MLRIRPVEACRGRSDADHAVMAMVQFRPLRCPDLMARQYRRRGAIMAMFVIAMLTMLMLQTASAFSIAMKYQPPVKFSVSSLYGGRKSRQSASSPSTPRQSAYAGTLSMPPPFEQRMREMILKAPPDGVGRSSADGRRRALPKNVIEVESLQEYKEVVVGNRKVVVVRFHASYCKACQEVAAHFYRMATEFPDVCFVDVQVSERNAALHQGLGIPTLPFAHLYYPGAGLLEEQKFSKKHVAAFKKTVQTYVQGCCTLEDD